jgi:anti-sigma factor RsiW
MESRVMDMLACYVNGTLSARERREVEGQLDASPALRNQLAFFEALRKEIRNGVPAIAPDLGLDRTLARIRGEPRPAPEAGWFARILPSGFTPRLAYSLGLAVIVLQAGAIGYLAIERGDEYSETRARTPAAPAVGPFVRVSFRTEVKESDIRFLLIGLGASIVGGPSQLGDYFLYLEPKRTDWAAQQLRQSAIVDSVAVIATLPAAKE